MPRSCRFRHLCASDRLEAGASPPIQRGFPTRSVPPSASLAMTRFPATASLLALTFAAGSVAVPATVAAQSVQDFQLPPNPSPTPTPTVQAKKRPKMTTNPPRGRRLAQTCLLRAEMDNPHCRRPCRTAGVTVGAKIPSGKSIWWPHLRGVRRGAVEAVQCKQQGRAAAGLECAQCVPAIVPEVVSEAQMQHPESLRHFP